MAGATEQFTATVSGQANPTITWSVDGVTGGNSTVGTITSAGLYTAPGSSGNHAIAAASSGTSQSATVQISVFTLSVSPGGAALPPGGTQQFTATCKASPTQL
jgi:hypothetical protein